MKEKNIQGKLPTDLFIVGHKLYGTCAVCNSIVRIDKPIIGGLHLCLPKEEREEQRVASQGKQFTLYVSVVRQQKGNNNGNEVYIQR